jgi:hypothetical protein
MWFDMIDPKLRDDKIQRRFFNESVHKSDDLAEIFISAIQTKQKNTNVSRFILSNEALLQQHKSFGAFVESLSQRVYVKLIAYARNPYDWLPSAYNQWCICHKTSNGAIPPFASGGRALLNMFEDLLSWENMHSEIFNVREFSTSIDVVSDFASFLSVEMKPSKTHVQQRVETTESVLRAVYNNRFQGEALPDLFNRAFCNLDFGKSPAIKDVLDNSFDYRESEVIIAERTALFSELRNRTQIDFFDRPSISTKEISVSEVQGRLLEHVLNIIMQQADRITALEDRLNSLHAQMKIDP